jgi:N-methylhydantoinase A
MSSSTRYLIGIDSGGTFTDFIALTLDGPDVTRVRVHKVLSTPDHPEQAVLGGISDLGLEVALADGDVQIVHGTTVATNATLEGTGVRTAFVTNRGFGDMLTIGRQTRPRLYDLTQPAKPPPVPDELLFEVDTRTDAGGNITQPLTAAVIEKLVGDVRAAAPQAVAINLLFSFLNDESERQLSDALSPYFYVSRSSFVLPEYREYERGIATWLNAWLGPLIRDYMTTLASSTAPSPVAIMQSSGLRTSASQAADRAVNLLLSGPVGGLTAARLIADMTGRHRLMTFDMGGTSTDVALYDGDITLTQDGSIGPYPLAIPMADIHTIGAGGGSIAFIDGGGLLRVGPRSAGAKPGPACYDLGGDEPTVTDANLVLGHLHPDAFLGGRMQLDVAAAERAIAPLAAGLDLSLLDAALGILRLANVHMAEALRVISIQRGHNPQDFTLLSFGGAGGLHVCDLAESLAMTRAIIPVNAGILSAVGLLTAPPGRESSRTHRIAVADADADAIRAMFEDMIAAGGEELRADGIDAATIDAACSVDCRYDGQTFHLNLSVTLDRSTERPTGDGEAVGLTIDDLADAFHEAHRQRYGHAMARPVEIINLRVRLTAPGASFVFPRPTGTATTFGESNAATYARQALAPDRTVRGPAMITEDHATTRVNAGWSATVDAFGNLLLEDQAGPR